MTFPSSRASEARARLARHVGRLRQGLDELGEQLRGAVARAVGRSAGDAVSEAVHAALGGPEVQPRPALGPPRGLTGRPSPPWQEPDDPWWREAEELGPGGQFATDDFDDRTSFDDYPERDESMAPSEERPPRRWPRAVAAGLQAAAWWARRHPGRASLLAALAVGAVAALASLLGHAAGAAGLVVSALGLACLADLAGSLSALLA
jgi:hypothetical protein